MVATSSCPRRRTARLFSSSDATTPCSRWLFDQNAAKGDAGSRSKMVSKSAGNTSKTFKLTQFFLNFYFLFFSRLPLQPEPQWRHQASRLGEAKWKQDPHDVPWGSGGFHVSGGGARVSGSQLTVLSGSIRRHAKVLFTIRERENHRDRDGGRALEFLGSPCL